MQEIFTVSQINKYIKSIMDYDPNSNEKQATEIKKTESVNL